MIILVDCRNIAYRAYYTTQEYDVSGAKCGLVTGALRIMSKAIAEIRSSRPEEHAFVVATFDFGRCMWRTERYPEYKANRQKTALDEFLPQIQRFEEMMPKLGCRVVKSLGTEADDFIGVLSTELTAKTGEDVFMVSSDKDLWQLVNERVFGIDLHEGGIVDEVRVAQRFGVPPSRVVEYKALVGDASDNIKGAKGIGEKTAIQIMERYASVHDLLREIEAGTVDVSTGPLKKLAACIPEVRLAGELCTIARTPEELFTEEARGVVHAVIGDVLEGRGFSRDPDLDMELSSLGLTADSIRGFIQ